VFRFVIDRQPPPVNASIPEEKELRKKKQREEDLARNSTEENTWGDTALSDRHLHCIYRMPVRLYPTC
jgi:hypothetical protein